MGETRFDGFVSNRLNAPGIITGVILEGDRPVNPGALGTIFIDRNTGEGDVWDGAAWIPFASGGGGGSGGANNVSPLRYGFEKADGTELTNGSIRNFASGATGEYDELVIGLISPVRLADMPVSKIERGVTTQLGVNADKAVVVETIANDFYSLAFRNNAANALVALFKIFNTPSTGAQEIHLGDVDGITTGWDFVIDVSSQSLRVSNSNNGFIFSIDSVNQLAELGGMSSGNGNGFTVDDASGQTLLQGGNGDTRVILDGAEATLRTPNTKVELSHAADTIEISNTLSGVGFDIGLDGTGVVRMGNDYGGGSNTRVRIDDTNQTLESTAGLFNTMNTPTMQILISEAGKQVSLSGSNGRGAFAVDDAQGRIRFIAKNATANNVALYANNAAAVAAGLTTGNMYGTNVAGDIVLKVVA